ncbi:uncharacterized protein LOC128323295 isoform X5 [Hemicordylus capensis]|uniref:uncharacterized protein LOC128323295 isoform X5 n=1 Tax=Hemicordylus capensis TaxID=884348 RepID=UPI002304A69F|nr:uncharacterized protein LOC128323295 isoform X5 [Hemicordylus capensis]
MAINDAGGERGLARLQRTRAAYVNEGWRSAISRFSPPNDASARHQQRLLQEAPTAAAAEGTQAAAKHAHTYTKGISACAFTLHNIASPSPTRAFPLVPPLAVAAAAGGGHFLLSSGSRQLKVLPARLGHHQQIAYVLGMVGWGSPFDAISHQEGRGKR